MRNAPPYVIPEPRSGDGDLRRLRRMNQPYFIQTRPLGILRRCTPQDDICWHSGNDMDGKNDQLVMKIKIDCVFYKRLGF